jgi:hypothetical protein
MLGHCVYKIYFFDGIQRGPAMEITFQNAQETFNWIEKHITEFCSFILDPPPNKIWSIEFSINRDRAQYRYDDNVHWFARESEIDDGKVLQIIYSDGSVCDTKNINTIPTALAISILKAQLYYDRREDYGIKWGGTL